ncbi:hypothetical protein T4D_1454 [Trichinella pseudospiralis]|uniref:Uncharacterized protein n=1 Tax=Trichinella pseudospiralis TaxID=6337 RepID=A0A0V1FVI7_TRIPS|nr:hypothetical protein T4D_1454 [Trichinella pseudospiralis]
MLVGMNSLNSSTAWNWFRKFVTNNCLIVGAEQFIAPSNQFAKDHTPGTRIWTMKCYHLVVFRPFFFLFTSPLFYWPLLCFCRVEVVHVGALFALSPGQFVSGSRCSGSFSIFHPTQCTVSVAFGERIPPNIYYITGTLILNNWGLFSQYLMVNK